MYSGYTSTCEICGKEFRSKRRADASICGATCRKRKSRGTPYKNWKKVTDNKSANSLSATAPGVVTDSSSAGSVT